MPKRQLASNKGPRRKPLRLLGTRLQQHAEMATANLLHLLQAPAATVMTVAVIAIALALPAGLYLVVRNLMTLSESWDQTTAISLFLTPETTLDQAQALAAKLRAHADLAEVELITPDAALSELGTYTGFDEAVAQLEENPLPIVLALQPASNLRTPAQLERLAGDLEGLSGVDFARLDTEWIRRFKAIVSLAERGVVLLAAALSVAVLLIIGNTIRLEIQNRRDEIEIMELVGATPAFIRRPFLYTGCWYGLLGGIASWLLVALALLLVQGPVNRLATLYHASFPLTGLGPKASLAMLGGSLLLGLTGSWLSVQRHLAASEPR